MTAEISEQDGVVSPVGPIQQVDKCLNYPTHTENNANNGVSSNSGSDRLSSVEANQSLPPLELPIKKKRRMLDDLHFASPGPAFMSASTSSDAATESEAEGSRARKPRLSTQSASNTKSFHQKPSDSSASNGKSVSTSHTFANPGIFRNVSQESPHTQNQNGHALVSQKRVRRMSSRTRDYDEQFATEASPSRRPRTHSSTNKQSNKPHPKSRSTASDGHGKQVEKRLSSKREEVDRVYHDHDTLVRELFHLRKFVTLIGYDPDLAKEDHSDVFERFRMEYDLPSALGSSGRTTRRNVSAKRGTLALPQSRSIQDMHQHSNGIRKSKSAARDASDSDALSSQDTRLHKKKRPRPVKVSKVSSESEDDSRLEERAQPQHKRRVRPSKGMDLESFHWMPKEPIQVEHIDGIPPVRAFGPANLPAPPRFNRSLSSYLRSWYATGEFMGGNGDFETLSYDQLLERNKRDVQLYHKIDEYRSQGLLQSREEAISRSHQSRSREPDRRLTAWDSTLVEMTNYASRRRTESRAKVALSKRIARMVEHYWDERLGRGEKQRKAEERRVRQLAKWTIREVRKQWKLAVSVIRAQRSAKEKAERDRMGRQQLNTILEQSSVMLDRQHRALLETDTAGSSEESELPSSDEDVSETEGSLVESVADDSELDNDTTPVLDSHKHDSSASQFPFTPTEKETTSLEGNGFADNKPDDISQSIHVIQPSNENEWQAQQELRPVRTTRRLDPAVLQKAAKDMQEGHDVEDDDDDFNMRSPLRIDEDMELERKMWEEDQSDSDEERGLEDDAKLSIEELLKKYNYDAEAMNGSPATSDEEEESHVANGGAHSDHRKIIELDADAQVDPSANEEAAKRRSISETRTATPYDDQSTAKVKPPFLLRGTLRPYQQIGFEWLVNLYNTGSNGILADEMGLGKTMQTIALLGHLACDKGIWGPHLVVAPTSVMLNWEVEFKKFFPGFKVLSYYGSQRERKEKRKGWNTENSFNVCITSYQLVLADQHILRRKPWQYLILDEAHHIKNFRSQRWQTLLGFNSQRRLLLTGTPLQNNLMDLWSLMYFLMPNGTTNSEGVVNSGFASMKEFQQWFSNPLDKAVGNAGVATQSDEMDSETRSMVSKLHTLLRPYLLRRLKSEVERELPNKYEHVIKCRLSKRQHYLYNDFMSRAKTRESLASGNYLSIINCLMQLRKVCNHPDLFEERPILTSFAMSRSAVADFETKELLVRRELLNELKDSHVNLSALNMSFSPTTQQHLTPIVTQELQKLDASSKLPHIQEAEPQPVVIDTWSIQGFKDSISQQQRVAKVKRWKHFAYLNHLRCQQQGLPLCNIDSMNAVSLHNPQTLLPFSVVQDQPRDFLNRCDHIHRAILSYEDRRQETQGFIDRFAFVTPKVVAVDMPSWSLSELSKASIPESFRDVSFDTLHEPAVRLQIAFPDASLLQYDCGKLQALAKLMEGCKYGSHRILIFTQMTKVLDILEKWLNFNGFNYLRLDGSTKVEDRQTLTEKFNRDERIKAFILSTRSGGLGINLTGADTVLFWDLDWNYQIEAQCMDRAHRIGQTRDVHIYRFVSEHTIEENMLKKSQEKRLLDAMIIQEGQFTTEGLSKMSWIESMFDEGGRTIAGVQVGGSQEVDLATNDRNVEQAMDAAEDEEDAHAAQQARAELHVADTDFASEMGTKAADDPSTAEQDASVVRGEQEEEEGGTIDDYMLRRVDSEWDYFAAM